MLKLLDECYSSNNRENCNRTDSQYAESKMHDILNFDLKQKKHSKFSGKRKHISDIV